jgi:hypothetical protein
MSVDRHLAIFVKNLRLEDDIDDESDEDEDEFGDDEDDEDGEDDEDDEDEEDEEEPETWQVSSSVNSAKGWPRLDFGD